MRRITLLTDFGTADGYVAAMKGVIAGIAPAAVVEDATHEIPPGDVAAAALALWRYATLYPPGSVHLAVVDPGVGSARRALAAEVGGRFFVAPDNGLLSRILADAQAPEVVRLENPAYRLARIAATFHGRDLFAPAAAHLARGIPLHELGPAVRDPVRLDLPTPLFTGEGIDGAVVQVDRFGNLITNIPGHWVPGDARVEVAGRLVGPLRRTYADVAPGELLALVGSAGLLEIAARDSSAAAALEAGRGAVVRVRWPGSRPNPGDGAG